MSKRLTAPAVAKIQWRPGKPNEHSDAGCPGLRLAVLESGKKRWIFRYRRPDTGRQSKLTLGPVDVLNEEQQGEPKLGRLLTLAAARKLASDAARQLALGNDPGLQRQDEKQETQAKRRRTFDWACREFIDRYSRPRNKKWRETARMLGLIVGDDDKLDPGHIKIVVADRRKGGPKKGKGSRPTLVEKWGDRPIASIRKRDIVEAMDEIVDDGAPYVAIVTLACLKKLFRWLAQRDVIELNPAVDVARPHEAKSRDRVLDADELVAFWRATAKLDDQTSAVILRLLLLLGQRKDEVRCLEAEEVTKDGLLLPGARMKNKQEHLVPLPEHALGLIERAPRFGNRYVFGSEVLNGRRPTANLAKAKSKLDALMLAELRELKADPGATLTPWRIHDLRRTCATGMARLRVQPHVIESVLSHRSGIISGVAATYNRHEYQEEKLSALETWGRYVLSLCEGTESNVTPIRPAATA